MTIPDDALRRAWQAGELRSEHEPDPERIWAAVAGELPPDELVDVLERVRTSSEWADAWRIAVEVQREQQIGVLGDAAHEAPSPEVDAEADVLPFPSPPRDSDGPQRRFRRLWVAPVILAAAVLLLLLNLQLEPDPVAGRALGPAEAPVAPTLSGTTRSGIPPRPSLTSKDHPSLRADGPRNPVYRDGVETTLVLVIPGEVVPRDGVRIRWEPVGERTRYDVTDAALNPVAELRGTDRAEWTVPAERVAHLPSGARLLLRVVALSPDGARLAAGSGQVTLR